MRNIRQNLFFAFVYNALGVPIAAGVLYPFIGLAAEPDDRRGGDEPELGVGDRERAPAASGAALIRAAVLRAHARGASSIAPPQLEPAPAVQPKQWAAVAIASAASSSQDSSAQIVGRAGAARERQLQHLIEVAVVEAPLPADAHQRAAHEVVDGAGVEVVDEEYQDSSRAARRDATPPRSVGSACW